jgi:hypothetical protein
MSPTSGRRPSLPAAKSRAFEPARWPQQYLARAYQQLVPTLGRTTRAARRDGPPRPAPAGVSRTAAAGA